jgi:hypothetical protein
MYLQIPPLGGRSMPGRAGQLTATTLGPVTLGATRAHARQLLAGYTDGPANSELIAGRDSADMDRRFRSTASPLWCEIGRAGHQLMVMLPCLVA